MLKFRETVKVFFGDYDRETLLSASCSSIVSAAFAFYNGFLGQCYNSLWHGSICVYYILILLLRLTLIVSNMRISRSRPELSKKRRKAVFTFTHIILLLLNLSLIVPISLMVKMQKPLEMTLIPAIAMAAYTTYKMIVASINMRKKKKTDNILVKELRTINFIDSLLSIAVLQNTLIMLNDHSGNSMLILSAITSSLILIFMIAVSALNFLGGMKLTKKQGR